MNMATYRIYGKDGKKAGVVTAQSKGHAKNKAVEEKIVSGRKQITKVIEMTVHDPYEQSFKDIYG